MGNAPDERHASTACMLLIERAKTRNSEEDAMGRVHTVQPPDDGLGLWVYVDGDTAQSRWRRVRLVWAHGAGRRR